MHCRLGSVILLQLAFPGKTTRISHGRNPTGTIELLKKMLLLFCFVFKDTCFFFPGASTAIHWVCEGYAVHQTSVTDSRRSVLSYDNARQSIAGDVCHRVDRRTVQTDSFLLLSLLGIELWSEWIVLLTFGARRVKSSHARTKNKTKQTNKKH